MDMFSTVYKMDQVFASQVHKMTVFVAIWHGPNFLKCGLASTVPANDIEYFYYMLELSEVSVVFVSRYRYGVRVGSSKEGMK